MKIKEIFIKNGNFVTWLRAVFIILGGGVVYVSIKHTHSIIFMSFGVGLAALGGYSSRAKSSGLKPFDSAYNKSRESYEEIVIKKKIEED